MGFEKNPWTVLSISTSSSEGRFPPREPERNPAECGKCERGSSGARGGASAGQREAEPELRAPSRPAGEFFQVGPTRSGGWRVVLVPFWRDPEFPRVSGRVCLGRGAITGARAASVRPSGEGRSPKPGRDFPLPPPLTLARAPVLTPTFREVSGKVHPPRQTVRERPSGARLAGGPHRPQNGGSPSGTSSDRRVHGLAGWQ